MSKQSESFSKNRRREFKEQVNYWRYNLESGFLRFTERIILGFNVSDILSGDLAQIEHLDEVTDQVKIRKLIQNATFQMKREESILSSEQASTPQYLFKIQNARVDTLTGLVVLDSGFIIDSTFAKWQNIIYRGGIGSSIKRTKRAKKKLAGTHMVMPHSPFYYHTVIDLLPNLVRIREENPECNKVVINSLAPKWAIEILEQFGFDVHVTKRNAVIVEDLFAISAPRVVVKRNLESLRLGLTTKPVNTLIVSRKGTPRNNDAIEESLAALIPGAQVVDPGQLSVAEQIQLFSKAKIIIGLHGGALTNCVWMDTSSKVIEIFNHAYRTSDYERLCMELGIKYQSVEIKNMNAQEVALIVERITHEF